MQLSIKPVFKLQNILGKKEALVRYPFYENECIKAIQK
jgi:hypothetical protein